MNASHHSILCVTLFPLSMVWLGPFFDLARGLGTDLQDLLGGFKGLTPLALEAGRLCDALPARVQSIAVELLRALERQVRGASPGDR